jgi:hypothetical protein
MTYEDAVAQSLMAGCDFSDKEFMDNIPAAVRDGKLTAARLDDALARVLRVRMRLGDFDPFDAVPYSRISPAVIDSAAHRAVARQTAQEAIVLLQNRGGLLPLDKTALKRIAVIGPLADRIIMNNYNGKAASPSPPSRASGTPSPRALKCFTPWAAWWAATPPAVGNSNPPRPPPIRPPNRPKPSPSPARPMSPLCSSAPPPPWSRRPATAKRWP